MAAASKTDHAPRTPALVTAKAAKSVRDQPGRLAGVGAGKPGKGNGASKLGHGHGRAGAVKPSKGDGTRTPGTDAGIATPAKGAGASKPAKSDGTAKPGNGHGRTSAGRSRKANKAGATPEGSSRKAVAQPATVTTTPAPAAPAAPATPVATVPAASAPAPSTAPPAASAPPVVDKTPAPATSGGDAPSSAAGTLAGDTTVGPFGGLAPASPSAGARTARTGARSHPRRPKAVTRTVVRTVRSAVEVVPGFVWALVAGLGLVSLLATGASSYMAGRARRLGRQREMLLKDVGLLQEALLPEAPAQIEGAAASVAYRAATSGPPGGDFYDVFALDAERLGLVVGRVSASGRRSLGVTALIRHILRAYLEGGLQPRNALQVGAEVLERHLGPDYACATLAVYDHGTSRLVYAGAGMPAPIVLGSAAFEPVTACSAPAIGMGVATGTRQTSVQLPPGAAACLFTDGLLDARLDGGRYGYRRAWHAVESLDGDAGALLERVAVEADASTDDIAAVLLRVGSGMAAGQLARERRLEELELGLRDLDGERPGLFLRDCGVPSSMIPEMVEELRETGARLGGAVLRVRYGPGVPEAEAGLRTMDVLHVGRGGTVEPGVSAAARPSGG